MTSTSVNPLTQSTTTIEEEAIELRKNGMSIAKIMLATGLPERRVKQITAHITKPSKTTMKVSRIPTPLAKASERAFALASRSNGIRDYEIRDILHEEYSSAWDTSAGKYRSNYTSDTLKRVKEKVRQRAASEGITPIFVMDWIDEEEPRASNEFLLSSAAALCDRIAELVTEYMNHHATRRTESSQEALLAQRKQRFAVEQYLLKLAVRGYGEEPITRLLARVNTLLDELEGTPDAPLLKNATTHNTSNAEDYFPEPSHRDAFLDFAESQGWLASTTKK
jgi:hypothetical protein